MQKYHSELLLKRSAAQDFHTGSRQTGPKEPSGNQVPLSDSNAFLINSAAAPCNPLDGPEQPATQGGPTHACEWMPILK